MCWQGGTCVIVGDEHARVTEAAKAAEPERKKGLLGRLLDRAHKPL